LSKQPEPGRSRPGRRRLTEAEWRELYRLRNERAAEVAVAKAEVEIAKIHAKPQDTLEDQIAATEAVIELLESLPCPDDPRVEKLLDLAEDRRSYLDDLAQEALCEESDGDTDELEPVELEPLPSLSTVLAPPPEAKTTLAPIAPAAVATTPQPASALLGMVVLLILGIVFAVVVIALS